MQQAEGVCHVQRPMLNCQLDRKHSRKFTDNWFSATPCNVVFQLLYQLYT